MTQEQILSAREFHENGCKRTVGPRGGITEKIVVWRRNGKTKLWKTRPNEFRIPVKFGLYAYGYVDHGNLQHFHASEDCPLLRKESDGNQKDS